MWRRETKLADFPVRLVGAATGAAGRHLRGLAHLQAERGSDKYLTIVEAQGDGRRYYKAYLADRLEGPWRGLADIEPSRSPAWPTCSRTTEWTTNISHGELLRTGVDETMEVDPASLRFLFQGASDAEYRGNPYGKIPWRLGILEMQ